MRPVLAVSVVLALLIAVLLGAGDAQAAKRQVVGELTGYVETVLLHVETCEDSVPECFQYEVNTGDTLVMIARRYDLTVGDIVEFNPQLCGQQLPKKFAKKNPCEFIRAGAWLLLPIVSLPESRVFALEAVIEALRDQIQTIRAAKESVDLQRTEAEQRLLGSLGVNAQLYLQGQRHADLWQQAQAMVVFLQRERGRLNVENGSLRYKLERQEAKNAKLEQEIAEVTYRAQQLDLIFVGPKRPE